MILRLSSGLLLMLFCIDAVCVENSLSRCVLLEDNIDRLRCYDALAGRNTVQQIPARNAPENQTHSADQTYKIVAKSKSESLKPIANDNGTFGKKPKNSAEEGEQLASVINAVSELPRGRRVMTLANGQIWVEDEAGKRRIEINQKVTISKRRWRYVMRMESGPIVPVHRID